MATITEIRDNNSSVTLVARPIYEPLSAPEILKKKLKRFGEHYDLSSSSYLFRFLQALCGESGAGSVKKEFLYPRLQSLLDATHFSDIDRLYGNPLGLPRISPELYTMDPKNEALTQAQWQEVKEKDAQYRARCLIWMRAIMHGPTLEGIALAAEAAIGIDCDVYERYKYIENAASDQPIPMTDIGITQSRNEFVIIPRIGSLEQADRRRISRMVDRLRPVNTLPTIYEGEKIRTERFINEIAATSEGFFVSRYVTGRADVDWPTPNPADGTWITTEEEEMPLFAFMDRQESITYLTINTVEASSEHVGEYNKSQRSLFGHLQGTHDIDDVASKDWSYARSFAPIQLTIPWTSTT